MVNMANSKLTQEQSDFIKELYCKYSARLYNIIISATNYNARIDCEAIVQDTFLTAIEKVDKLIKYSKPERWLYITAHNKTMDALKRKSNTTEELCPIEEMDEYEDTRAGEDTSLSKFEHILTKEEYELLNKHWRDGFQIAELARQGSVNPGALRMRMSRIYKKIKNSIMFYTLCCFFVM